MLRSVALALIAVITFSVSSLFADEEQKPKATDKAEIKKREGEESNAEKKPTKGNEEKNTEKKPVKEKPNLAVIGNETDYYTTSPAQGRPADGKLKAGTKVRVVEKAGSYVRVIAQVEMFVPADSLKQARKKKADVQKGDGDKGPADKAAAEKQAAIASKAIAELRKVASENKAIAEKAAAIEKEAAAQQKKAAAIKKGESKDLEKKDDDK